MMDPSSEIEKKIKEIIKYLKTDINEENLLKAGTEFELNMRKDYEQTIGQKLINLRKELNSMNIGNKDEFSIDDFYKFFSSKNPGVKKEDIKSLLELTAPKLLGNEISLNDFVKSYILLEEKIKLKKEDLSRVINQQRKKIEKYQDKLKEFEREEYYSQGISKQNELSIHIMEIINLQGIYRCKIILYLMNKSGEILDEKETRTVAGSNPMTINEIFSFQVTDAQCYVKCIISDSDTLINEGHGYFIINLDEYLDQMRKKRNYPINGEQNNASVNISCIFTYNNKKKYTDLISKVTQEIDSLAQIIFQLDTIIDKTKEPFGLIYYNKIKEIKDKNFLGKLNISEDLSNSRISIYSNLNYQESPNKMRYSGENDNTRTRRKDQGLGSIPEEGSDAINSNLLKNEIKSTEGYLPENFNRYIPKSTFLGKKSTQLIIFGILVSLVSFLSGKFDVLNFILFIFGLMMAYNVVNINGRFDTMRYYFYAILIVIAFDTFWILFLNREQNIESSFWRVIVFGLTIVSLIIKIVLSYLIKNRRR